MQPIAARIALGRALTQWIGPLPQRSVELYDDPTIHNGTVLIRLAYHPRELIPACNYAELTRRVRVLYAYIHLKPEHLVLEELPTHTQGCKLIQHYSDPCLLEYIRRWLEGLDN